MVRTVLHIGTIGVICAFALILIPRSADAQTTEAQVRAYFADTPVMIEIARCESKFRQYRSDGSPLYGGLGNGMVGIFQFNESVHADRAASLGHDLATLDGNLGYAKHLYMMEGTEPWNSSRSCWQNAIQEERTAQPSRAALLSRIAKLQELLTLYQRLLALRQTASR